jgi:hypothetical protein
MVFYGGLPIRSLGKGPRHIRFQSNGMAFSNLVPQMVVPCPAFITVPAIVLTALRDRSVGDSDIFPINCIRPGHTVFRCPRGCQRQEGKRIWSVILANGGVP